MPGRTTGRWTSSTSRAHFPHLVGSRTANLFDVIPTRLRPGRELQTAGRYGSQNACFGIGIGQSFLAIPFDLRQLLVKLLPVTVIGAEADGAFASMRAFDSTF
jgi:hypothetical protein